MRSDCVVCLKEGSWRKISWFLDTYIKSLCRLYISLLSFPHRRTPGFSSMPHMINNTFSTFLPLTSTKTKLLKSKLWFVFKTMGFSVNTLIALIVKFQPSLIRELLKETQPTKVKSFKFETSCLQYYVYCLIPLFIKKFKILVFGFINSRSKSMVTVIKFWQKW